MLHVNSVTICYPAYSVRESYNLPAGLNGECFHRIVQITYRFCVRWDTSYFVNPEPCFSTMLD